MSLNTPEWVGNNARTKVSLFPIRSLWPPLLFQSTVVKRKYVKSGREKKTELGTLWPMAQTFLLRTVVPPMNVEHRKLSTRSITLAALVEVTLALVPGLVGRRSTGKNRSRCLGLLLSVLPAPRMRSCLGKKSMSSLISRDSMLLMAGFPKTSYPWLRSHTALLLHVCSFQRSGLVFTLCACSQIRFISVVYQKILVKRTFKAVSAK
jgi:hypothetical protein